MSDMRVSDPSTLHLKKELTQIRKATRLLRDPGTTSSCKSPLNTSRSAAAALASAASRNHSQSLHAIHNAIGTHLDSQLKTTASTNIAREKRVFLHNWKSHKSSTDKTGVAPRTGPVLDADDDSDSCSLHGSLDNSLSDARNDGNSKSDSFMGGESRSASGIFRCRDTNLVSPSMKQAARIKKKSKKNIAHLNAPSRYRPNEINLRRLLRAHPSVSYSVEQSDGTEEFSDSEDLRKTSEASPLFSKLRHRHWTRSPSKLLRGSRKEDSSYSYGTPALSASSFTRDRIRNPSTVGSWDTTTASLKDGYDDLDDHLDLPGRRGCGIPCYWSRRTPRHGGGACRGCCSPSLSDTLRRKGSSMLCGSRSMHHGRRRSSSISSKQRAASRSARGVLPLLTYSGDGRGSSIGTGHSDDELSTNFEELDLEALSILDGRRWSGSRSQDGLEMVALNGDVEDEGTPENIRSLSQKYKPVFFGQLIGQNIVVHSLVNAISRGRIAPVYLFQGPRGTGKTSAAKIFASALNCTSTEETRPCGYCRECTDFISGKTRDLWEVDGSNAKEIDKVRYLLEKIYRRPPVESSRYKILLIDECHLLPSKMWLAFLKFLEEPPQRVVFIFITTDPDNVPRTVQSRCQKYLFNKIRDGEIVTRLRKISNEENLDVETEALELMALNADGSLRDAETMLDQLSLLGKKITTSLVNELVGVVSDDKLLELLGLAMSSDTAETVKSARDLMDSGVDPMVLMSQLASLIMDIIAGTYGVVNAKHSDPLFRARNLTEAELERLKHALKLLSEAEKQLRVSSDRSTWFTATLLQLGSMPSPNLTQSSSSWRQSSRTTDEHPSVASRESDAYKGNSDARILVERSSPASSLYKAINGNSSHRGEYHYKSKPPRNRLMDGGTSSASQDSEMVGDMGFIFRNSEKLDGIWAKCIRKCHSKTLRQLLHVHGKLLSISDVEGVVIVYVGFGDGEIKSRAERFLSSMTNSIEMVLKQNVEVRLVLMSDDGKQRELQEGQKRADATSGMESGNAEEKENEEKKSSGVKEKEIPMQRIESIIREQRLETAWLQAVERGTPGSLGRVKGEKNQVHPQEEDNRVESRRSSEEQREEEEEEEEDEDELNRELKVLKKQQIQRSQCPISPSLLHDINFIAKDTPRGYDSGSGSGSGSGRRREAGGGCGGRLFCWNTTRPHSNKKKVRGTHVRSRSGKFSLFGECGKKPKKAERGRAAGR